MHAVCGESYAKRSDRIYERFELKEGKLRGKSLGGLQQEMKKRCREEQKMSKRRGSMIDISVTWRGGQDHI